MIPDDHFATFFDELLPIADKSTSVKRPYALRGADYTDKNPVDARVFRCFWVTVFFLAID
jgi:hypothetical protein